MRNPFWARPIPLRMKWERIKLTVWLLKKHVYDEDGWRGVATALWSFVTVNKR